MLFAESIGLSQIKKYIYIFLVLGKWIIENIYYEIPWTLSGTAPKKLYFHGAFV